MAATATVAAERRLVRCVCDTLQPTETSFVTLIPVFLHDVGIGMRLRVRGAVHFIEKLVVTQGECVMPVRWRWGDIAQSRKANELKF